MVTTNRLATLLIICGASIVSAFAFAPATTDRQRLSLLSSTTSTDEVVNVVDDVATNPRKEGLALMLDDGTRKSHSMAENTAFVSGFFKGIATKEILSRVFTTFTKPRKKRLIVQTMNMSSH